MSNDSPRAFSWSIPHVAIVAIALVAALLVVRDHLPTPQERVISVSASGRVLVKPDVAQLRIGVTTTPKPTASEATREGNDQMNRVVAAIKEAGVEANDIQTSLYNLTPQYNYSPQGGRTLGGYELMQEARVKVRNLDAVSAVLSAATGAGANQVGDVQFVIDDPEAARTQARNEAIDKAKAKARQLAGVTGIKLGKIVDVLEDYGEVGPQPYADRAIGMGGAGAVPAPSLEVGQNEVVVNVSLVYEVR